MRIAYMSDLHLEFEPPHPSASGWEALRRAREALPGHPDRGPLLKPLAGSDLVVLAGDIDLGLKAVAYADQLAIFVGCPVIMVAGNHEYYGHDFDRLKEKLRRAAWETKGRVIFLERDSVRLLPGGHPLVIHGCTLWTDYGLNGSPEVDMAYAQQLERILTDENRKGFPKPRKSDSRFLLGLEASRNGSAPLDGFACSAFGGD